MKPVIFSQRTIDAVVKEDAYIEALADELMLDEVLCGECDSKEFLKLAMKRTFAEYRKKRLFKVAELRREELDNWSNS